MKTLKELIIEAKCRKGEAHGTTKRGAYWCPFVSDADSYFVVTGDRGGDGIGQNAADVTVGLDLRHFRDGTVSAVLEHASYHQNTGHKLNSTTNADQLLNCTTAEEVVVALRGIELINDCGQALSTRCVEKIIARCVEIGMPKAAPAPDEA